MILAAPASAVEVLGICQIVAGPAPGVVRYTGWAEVWLHWDGRRRIAFPDNGVITGSGVDIRSPKKQLWIQRVKGSDRPLP